MSIAIKEEGGFRYIEQGQGEVVILLHGLFGALSNWKEVLDHLSVRYQVVIPMLPIYTMPLKEANLEGLRNYLADFIDMKGLDRFSLIGNSLGGHLALEYVLAFPEKVKKLVLTGSSGLYENTMGSSFPRRGSYDFIKDRVEYTFYDPAVATKQLVDEVFEVTTSNLKCLRIVSFARSAQKNNLRDSLPRIQTPTLLLWGLNDTITPPSVAHEFHMHLPNSELRFVDRCSHVPMMEHPELFNSWVEEFLVRP